MFLCNVHEALPGLELSCLLVVRHGKVLEAGGAHEELVGGVRDLGADLCEHGDAAIYWHGCYHYEAFFGGSPYFYSVALSKGILVTLSGLSMGSAYPRTRQSCSESRRRSLIAYRTLLGRCMGARYDIAKQGKGVG